LQLKYVISSKKLCEKATFLGWGEIFNMIFVVFSPLNSNFYHPFRPFTQIGVPANHIFCQSKRTWYFCIANKKNRIAGKQKR